jgi:hypothetical protein
MPTAAIGEAQFSGCRIDNHGKCCGKSERGNPSRGITSDGEDIRRIC